MNAFRLQTFAPAFVAHVGRAGPQDRLIERVREEAYRSGFVDGQAEATEAHLEDQSRLTAELIEALDDARMTNEAARRHVAASFAPVVRALVEALAPALVEAGLAQEIVRIAEAARAAAPEARPRLRCAPELAGRLAGLCRERGLEADVELAPELLPREAQVHWDQGYDHIDLDATVAGVRDLLAAHLESQEGSMDDDERRAG